MSDITKENFIGGAIPSEYDERDYSVKVCGIVSFPEKYMIRDVEIYNQGDIGNCVMQAIRSAPHKYYGVKPGATFGYGRWRIHDGTGMSPNLACNGFVKEGIPPEVVDNKYLEMPEAREYAEDNEERMLLAAAPYKGWKWARLYTIDEIKATLLQEEKRPGLRCIVCLPFYNITTDGYWAVEGGRCSCYHEMVIAGWDDAKGWKLRNSWGKKKEGSIGMGIADGYVWVRFGDIFACDDVIALFPPEEKRENGEDEKIVTVRRTLKLKAPRMTGDDVREAQTLLNKHGEFLKIDGIFGTASDAATKTFQSAKELTVDGIIGKNTWAALDKEPAEEPIDRDRMELAEDMTAWLRMMLGDHYIIGAQGHKLTMEYLDRQKASHPAYFTGGRYEWLRSEIERAAAMGREICCEDCSGLFFKVNEMMHIIKESDLTADGLWHKCSEIDLADVKPLDILFQESGGEMIHMAIVGTDGVYEAAGTAYGVVFRPMDKLLDRTVHNRMTGKMDKKAAWTHAGRLRL